jgi:hypothetical protein
LIGVIPKAGQAAVVEEFFQLFKTPWEFYRPDRDYEVVIVTADRVPEIAPPLLLIFSSDRVDADANLRVIFREQNVGGKLYYDEDVQVPIFDKLVTFADGANAQPFVTSNLGTAGILQHSSTSRLIRLGYDLFEEARFLLSVGQPSECANIPTLDLHIQMLRKWRLDAGNELMEIVPVPVGHKFIVCLTHDIDFVGIRNHKFDYSMFGFVYRATIGAFIKFCQRRLSIAQLFRNWGAVLSLPFVYAGWAKDFWEPFEWYLEAEKGLPSTYYLIPFKRHCGDHVPGNRGYLRATAYDVSDLFRETELLREHGCELGVHAIDAWHSVEKGRDELARIMSVTGTDEVGVRSHWLLRDANTPQTLEHAGYTYDSTVGYNETVGYRAGTSQVFRPFGTQTLLELPLHIQDGALFFPDRLNLTELAAQKRCQDLIDIACDSGGVLTILWHDRSHGPERFWGEFYIELIQQLKSANAWFGTAKQVVDWFRQRREVRFETVQTSTAAHTRLRYKGPEICPPLMVRIYSPHRRLDDSGVASEALSFTDVPFDGTCDDLELSDLRSVAVSGVAECQAL